MAKARQHHDLQVSTVKARATFAEVINRAVYGRERIVLTRRGKRIAAVVPFEDVRILERLDRKSTRLNSSHIQKSRMPSSA